MSWVLLVLDELESDFSRFHRVDDFQTMDATRFLRLAPFIASYQGAVFLALSSRVAAPHASVSGEDDGVELQIDDEAAAIAFRRGFMQEQMDAPIEWVSEDEILKEMGVAAHG